MPQVDPYAEVRRRKTRETTDTLDAVAGMTKQFRNQLGGVFGGLLGAVLDMATGFRDVQKTISQRMPSGPVEHVAARLPAGVDPGVVRQRRPDDERDPDVLATVKKAEMARYARQAAKPQAPGTIQYPGPEVILSKPPQTFAQAQAGTPATRAALARNRAMTEGPQSMAAFARRKALQTAPVQAAAAPEFSPMTAAGIAGAAAGPIAIVGAVIAGMVALKAVTMNAVDAVGHWATTLSNPSANPSQAFEALGGQVTKTTEAFVYVGNALGILGPVVGRSIEIFGRIMDNLEGTARRYEQYNPQLATSVAFADVRQTLGDLRRAQTLGPDLARYIDSQSRFQQSFEDLKADFVRQLLPVVSETLTGVKVLVDVARPLAPLARIAIESSLFINVLRAIGRWLGEQEQQIELPTPLAEILEERGIRVP